MKILLFILILSLSALSLSESMHPELQDLFFRMESLSKRFHKAGSPAPLAAHIDKNGEVHGDAIINEEGAEPISVQGALDYYEEKYRKMYKNQGIKGALVMFHGNTILKERRTVPATSIADANSLYFYLEYEGEAYESMILYSCQGENECAYGKPRFKKAKHRYLVD